MEAADNRTHQQSPQGLPRFLSVHEDVLHGTGVAGLVLSTHCLSIQTDDLTSTKGD